MLSNSALLKLGWFWVYSVRDMKVPWGLIFHKCRHLEHLGTFRVGERVWRSKFWTLASCVIDNEALSESSPCPANTAQALRVTLHFSTKKNMFLMEQLSPQGCLGNSTTFLWASLGVAEGLIWLAPLLLVLMQEIEGSHIACQSPGWVFRAWSKRKSSPDLLYQTKQIWKSVRHNGYKILCVASTNKPSLSTDTFHWMSALRNI